MNSPQACKRNRAEPSTPAEPAGALYVHVPFCLAKCRYCDFYSVPLAEGAARRFVLAALTEFRQRQQSLAQPLGSVFFGGGTPTALGPLLEPLLAAVGPLLGPATEVTVEANPGTIGPAVAGLLASRGVHRVSLGVQSFQDEELKVLGRIHTADEARSAVGHLREAGIENVNLDLIYGIPGQTLSSWAGSLGDALDLAPRHLSCYALSLEEGVPLARDVLSGRLPAMADSLQKECYLAAAERAGRAGMEHYEISNFAQPGCRCLHNVTCWRNLSYLGIGPGAASYISGVRRINRPDLAGYLAALEQGLMPPADDERLTGRAAMAEALMLGLRMMEGVEREDFRRRYGQDPLEAFPRSTTRHLRDGGLLGSPAHLRLSPGSLFVSDTILAEIIAEA